MRLDQAAALDAILAPRPAGDLRQELKVRSAARGSAGRQAQIAVDYADRREDAGNCGPWRRAGCRSRIGASPRATFSDDLAKHARIPGIRSLDEIMAVSMPGKRSATSSATRSTPGPHWTSEPPEEHFGQLFGGRQG